MIWKANSWLRQILPACRMHGYTREEFIGLQLLTCIHPDSQYVFSKSIQVFQSDGIFDIQTLDMRRDGSTFYAAWRGTAFTYQGRPCLLNIVRDVSKRVQIEQSLGQRVETRTHEQETLLEISHTLASTLELQPGLILDQVAKDHRIFPWRTVCIGRLFAGHSGDAQEEIAGTILADPYSIEHCPRP